MSDLFKWIGITVVVIIADGLFCLFLAFLTNDDDNKWIPAFVVNFAGFVSCLTILIDKMIG